MGFTGVRTEVPSRGSNRREPIEAQWSKIENSASQTLLSRIFQLLTNLLRKDSAQEFALEGEALEPAQIHAAEVLLKEGRFLVVNWAQIVKSTCACCGERLAPILTGERILRANLADSKAYLFCSACGDNIASHFQSERAAKQYDWDWAIPLRSQ